MDRLKTAFLSRSGMFFTFCFVFLSVIFSADPFETVPKSFFRKTLGAQELQRIDPLSESLIFGRELKARSDGGIGFAEWLGTYDRSGLSWPERTVLHDKLVRDGAAPDDNDVWSPYKSEFGLQGMVFTTVLAVSPLSPSLTLDLLQIIYAMALALSLSHLILWAAGQFGYGSGILLVLLTAISPWLIAFADSPYWAIFLAFIPLNITIHFLSREQGDSHFSIVSFTIWLSTAFLIKALCGYTYYSAIVSAAAVPFIYYWVQGRITPQQLTARAGAVVASGAIGFAISFLLLSLRNGVYDNTTFTTALSGNIDMMLRRTLASSNDGDLGYNFSMEPIERTLNSLDAPILEVVQFYLVQDILVGVPLWQFVLGCILVGVFLISSPSILPGIAASRQKLMALYATFLISLCAPLTWYVLGKAHAYIHTFWAMVAWHIPAMFFAGLLAVTTLRLLAMDIGRHIVKLRLSAAASNMHAALALLILGAVALAYWQAQSASREQASLRAAPILSADRIPLAAGWEAVLQDDWLYIIAKRCHLISPRSTIRLNVSGELNGAVVEQTLDFRWETGTMLLPELLTDKNMCAARRLLPDISVTTISIAEESPLYGILWQAEISQ